MNFALHFLISVGINVKCIIKTEGWGFDVTGKCCYGTAEAAVISPEQIISSIDGQSESSFTNRDVISIRLESQIINSLPKNIEKFLPGLLGISVSSAKLKSIGKSDLKPFVLLRYLHVPNNELEILYDDLFEFNPEIRGIKADNNRLKFIGANIFANLRKFGFAYFNNNICVNQEAAGESKILALTQHFKRSCAIPEVLALKAWHKSEVEDLIEQINHLDMRAVSTDYQLNSCRGNLDSASTNLFMLENQDSISSSSEAHKVSLTCIVDDESCKVIDFKVKFHNSHLTEVKTGSGQLVATNEIGNLMIIHQQTFFLPINLHQNFPQLTVLNVINSGLYKITASNFEGFKNLTTLNLNHNKLMKISSNTFKDLQNLQTLNLSFNKILIIEIDAFKGLGKLNELQMNNNDLETIRSNDFKDAKNLEHIHLQNNKLKFIVASFLSQFAQLSSSDLSDNVCINMSFPSETKEEIHREIMENCSAPIEMKCYVKNDKVYLDELITIEGFICKAHDLKIQHPRTKITKVDGDQNININNITIFVAVEQEMTFMPNGLAKFLPNLENILIERSKLSAIIKGDVNGLIKLQWMSLRHNNISSIEKEAFDDCMQIGYLNLAYNNIASLPPKIFVNLVNLETLILSHNKITALSSDILQVKSSIKVFQADNNQIELIEIKIMKALSKSNLVDFSVNECIDMKFDKSNESGKTFENLFMAIFLSCSAD